MTDSRRAGDTRSYRRDPSIGLTWVPARDVPFRWLPRHGEPWCVFEWITQETIKMIAWFPVYLAIFLILTLLVQIFGVPFIGGG